MQWVCHNGVFVPQQQPLFTAANRGFRYGDGLFETAKWYKGRLLLARYHFDRLFSGLQLLQMVPQVSAARLLNEISDLCERNGCNERARVRLALYREDGNTASYVIEAAELEAEKMTWNENGWQVIVYPFARKSGDAFANLKTANYLPYIMASKYAAEKKADESIVLNTSNRICDGSRTNLFMMTGNDVFTPALSEGCVNGVTRRHVIGVLKSLGYAVHQKGITETDVLQAETVFMTNALEGLRWVRCFGAKTYGHGVLKKLYLELFSPVYDSDAGFL